MGLRAVVGGAVLTAALLAGCTAASPNQADVSPAPTAGPKPLQVPDSCPSSLDSGATTSLKEVRGEAPAGESLYGLLFASYPIAVGREAKIAWRMTGAGPLVLDAIGPAGQHIAPVWGPEVHGGSTWDRPGEEWGSGFLFGSAGCWTVMATRGATVAHAKLLVG